MPQLHNRSKLMWALMLSMPAVLAQLATTAYAGEPIRWQAGAAQLQPFNADQGRQDQGQAQQAQAVRAPANAKYMVLQFEETVKRPKREALAKAGVRLQKYLGGHAYFARVRPNIDLGRVSKIAKLTGAEAIRRAWKLDPRVAAKQAPQWAVGGDDADGSRIVAVYVAFHEDVELFVDAANLAFKHGAVVQSFLKTVNGLVAEMPENQIDALADEDGVQWIEYAMPGWEETNDSNRALVQADAAQQAPYDLDGTGVDVFVYDGGSVLASHVDFAGRVTVIDGTGVSGHATHVAGTVLGSGAAGGGTLRGMAPNATLISAGFENQILPFFYADPGDIEADMDNAIHNHGADISNASIGTNTAANGFDCNITGNYGMASGVIDAVARGELGTPFRMVWANGNERGVARCGTSYASTAPPACAKNHMTVGSVNSNNDNISSFSSWGPCDDGRIKPDVSAPGCQSNGDGGVSSATSSCNTCYATLCGTSMASPTACGAAALVLQDFREQFPGLPDFRNSTLRALMGHTAQDRGNTGPDYQYGYGSIRVQNAIDLMRLGKLQEDQLDHGETRTYQIDVQPGHGPLRVTLAWDDPAATFNVTTALINDLDLKAISPSQQEFFPWTLDPQNPGNVAQRTQADHINNIELVVVDSPQSGVWTIEVSGFDVPDGPQPFSLVGDGPQLAVTLINLPNGVPAVILPGDETPIAVETIVFGQELVEGSVQMHYRYGGDAFLAQVLAPLGGNDFEALLPGGNCGDKPEFYFSIEGAETGVVFDPPDAPATTYQAAFGDENNVASLLLERFETDAGWTVQNVNVDTGEWEWGAPAGGGTTGDPLFDFDGSSSCYLTGNTVGEDVDGGPTILTSTLLNMDGMIDPLVTYARWFQSSVQGGGEGNDQLTIEASNDNGQSWTLMERLGSFEGWQIPVQRVRDYLPPTDQMLFRFSTLDVPNNSVTEAGIDFFGMHDIACEDDVAVATPIVFDILRGLLVSGDVAALSDSDNTSLVIDAGFTLNANEPNVWIAVEGTAPTETPTTFAIRVETRGSTPGLEQTLALYNYQTEQFEEVDVRTISGPDSVLHVATAGDLSRFVEPGTLTMRVEISWKPPAIVLMYPWRVFIDQVQWTVGQ